MKIIKRGEMPDLLPINAVCNYCKTEIEFMPQEAKVISDRMETFLIVCCPVCSKEIWTKKR